MIRLSSAVALCALLAAALLVWRGVASATSPAAPLIVPGHPVAVLITYSPGFSGGSRQTIHVTKKREVARLVYEADHLTAPPHGTIHCPLDDGSSYKLWFTYANGDRWTVTVDRRGCRFVRSNSGTAWGAVVSSLHDDLAALFA